MELIRCQTPKSLWYALVWSISWGATKVPCANIQPYLGEQRLLQGDDLETAKLETAKVLIVFEKDFKIPAKSVPVKKTTRRVRTRKPKPDKPREASTPRPAPSTQSTPVSTPTTSTTTTPPKSTVKSPLLKPKTKTQIDEPLPTTVTEPRNLISPAAASPLSPEPPANKLRMYYHRKRSLVTSLEGKLEIMANENERLKKKNKRLQKKKKAYARAEKS